MHRTWQYPRIHWAACELLVVKPPCVWFFTGAVYVQVFQAWHAQAQVSAHQTHTANTQWCGTVLRAWHVATNARRTQRNLLLRTQLRKEQRLMCRVFTAWVDLVTQARVARAAADGLAGRRDRALLARAWQGLQAGVTVGYLTHNAAVRMAQRRTQTTLRAAWGAWCDLAAMRAVAHAKAEALSQRRCVAMVARVLRAWRAETADATSAMRAGELRHVRSLYTRVWRGWTGAVKQSRYVGALALAQHTAVQHRHTHRKQKPAVCARLRACVYVCVCVRVQGPVSLCWALHTAAARSTDPPSHAGLVSCSAAVISPASAHAAVRPALARVQPSARD